MTQPAVLGDVLAVVDAEVRARTELLTLGPGPRASLPSELVAAAMRSGDPPALHDAIARGTATLVRVMLEAFPRNLLWDLDTLVATQAALGRQGWDVEVLLERIAALQHTFGEHGSIRFRYVHDFIYGFDWAKWVGKGEPRRQSVGPFDPEFIAAMAQRGSELQEAIRVGRDRKYPPLPPQQVRNPFGFSREPADELRLHRALASASLLPVEAWRIDAEPRWEADFAALRRDKAAALGLHTSS